ncbi:MAG: ABC transporter ATP-binding protein [Pseudomonadota bacterium]
MLKAENLSLGYGTSPDIVSDISFHIPPGEFVILIGPNGSGKSTLLRALAAILKPRAGRLFLAGNPLHRYAPRELARKIAFLPQSPMAPADCTVRDLIGYGRSPHLRWSGRMTGEDWRIMTWAMTQTRIEVFADRLVASLSGGECRRAWLAMALAQQPRLLLLDEPTTFLDICCQFEVLELVKELNRSLGITIIAVLHDLNQALRYADRIMALHDGAIAADGPPAEVIVPGSVAKIFNISVEIHRDNRHDCPFVIPLRSLKMQPPIIPNRGILP